MSELKALLEQADRAVSDVPLPADGLEGLRRRRDRKRRNQRIAAGVVGIAVFVAAIWVVTSVGSLDRTQGAAGPAETGPAETGPTTLEQAFPPAAVPPPGATPSGPENGELILSVWVSGYDNPPVREELAHMHMYADGRMIWSPGGALPESADGYQTGLVEQRLTPEGVELMRSAVMSSGLIDPDSVVRPGGVDHDRPSGGVMVDGEADPDPFPFFGTIFVRDADRFIGREFAAGNYQTGAPHNEGETTCVEGWGCAHIANAEEESALKRLTMRLADPASWLPASAWADQEIRAYVPITYRVCYGGTKETIEPDRLLHAIPGPVQELLEARDAEKEEFTAYLSFGEWLDNDRLRGYCSDLTTEEARVVIQGLDDGGFEREQVSTYSYGPGGAEALATFEYIFSVPGSAGPAALWVDPYLPHGEPICIPCQ